ncbi:hypothetical protein [Ferrovibrio sp.]|uniref:hypothetical protein n=1 Tax=Ferrovibrio sp. TaxID=1917215 RepID=UPI002639F499|nr:hypothetical protein [Ferrovibrio sp.]
MIRFVLAILVYIVATFATQAVSHFTINAAHYAELPHLRAEPIFSLGFLSMLIQGTALAFLHANSEWARRSLLNSVLFAWIGGSLIVSYIAFAEAAKYSIPSIPAWVWVEISAGFVQFTLYGVALGLIRRKVDLTQVDGRGA